MPARDPDPKLKLLDDRIVPARRFNLTPGAPSKAMKALPAKAFQRVFEGMRIAAHPVLRSVELVESEEEETPLPVVTEEGETEAALFADRYDEDLRWYLSDFELVDPKEGGVLFTARPRMVTGPEGGDVLRVEGVVCFAFTRGMNEATERAVASLKEEQPEVSVREIPLTINESELLLRYWDDENESERAEAFTTAVDAEAGEARFDLKDARLKVAYANLSRDQGVELRLVGEYDGWERIAEAEAEAEEATDSEAEAEEAEAEQMMQEAASQMKAAQRIAQAVRVHEKLEKRVSSNAVSKLKARFRSRRRGAARKRTVVRSRRGRVRDHREENARVRDHRDGKRRRRRGHRKGNVRRRDHRDEDDEKRRRHRGRARRGKDARVRDHRQKGSEKASQEASDLPEETFAKQRYIFKKRFQDVSYPCTDYLHQYRTEEETEEDAAQSFGCTPPWSEDFERGKRYKKLTLPDADLPVSVYESLAAPDTFLIFPDRYVIARTTDDAAPAVAMMSTIDPEGRLGSDVTFDVAVAPDVSDYERALLRQQLYAYTSRQDGVARPPVLEWPSDLPQSAKVAFTDRFCTLAGSEPDGDHFLLTLRCDPVEHALSVMSRLREKSAKLLGNLTFAVEDGVTESSALALDLNQTTGSVLQITRSGGTATLSNVCESPVVLDGFLLHDPDRDGASPHALPAPVTLSPGAQHTLTLPGEAPPGLAVDYHITEDPALGLSERRIDVSEWSGTLVVNADLDPTQHDASSIQVELRFEAAEQRTVCELVPDERQFTHEMVELTFPLDRYLDPEQRVVEYRAEAQSEDGRVSSDGQADWRTHDLTTDGMTLTIEQGMLG